MVDGLVIENCEKVGGRIDPERGCVLEEIAYGEPSWLRGDTSKRAQWLPPEVQKKFWQANFSRDNAVCKLAETELNSMGVVEVPGSIHIPLEPCNYSKMFRRGSVIFVPKVCERNSDRFMKFQAVALQALIPLSTKLTLLTEGM
jgi:hypothetical protein